MKAVILNDTSTEGHHGCSRVMEQIYGQLARNNVEILAKSFINEDLRAISVKKQIDLCDLAIINGEGTIHHGRPYAEDMLRLVSLSSAKIKVLCNSTYDSNPPHFRTHLEKFDYIFVRDQRSQAELSQLGMNSVVTPDITFLAPRSPSKKPVHEILVCDSVDRSVLAKLYATGKALGCKAHPISIFEPQRKFFGRLIEVRRSLAKKDIRTPLNMIQIARARCWFTSRTCNNHDEFAAQIARSAFLLTGRYHAVCMAIKNRTPFLAVDSNTFKIRALLEDIGLQARCIGKSEFLAGVNLEFHPFSATELELIEDFDCQARDSIQNMFAQILTHG
jgi:polysaccharide pyruvyl transferase WcaK-like protein